MRTQQRPLLANFDSFIFYTWPAAPGLVQILGAMCPSERGPLHPPPQVVSTPPQLQAAPHSQPWRGHVLLQSRWTDPNLTPPATTQCGCASCLVHDLDSSHLPTHLSQQQQQQHTYTSRQPATHPLRVPSHPSTPRLRPPPTPPPFPTSPCCTRRPLSAIGATSPGHRSQVLHSPQCPLHVLNKTFIAPTPPTLLSLLSVLPSPAPLRANLPHSLTPSLPHSLICLLATDTSEPPQSPPTPHPLPPPLLPRLLPP